MMSLSQLFVDQVVLIHDKKLTNIATSEVTECAPPMDSLNMQLHIFGAIPSKRDPETSSATPTH